MKIITGNDLETGRVIWWAGDGWSLHVEDAACRVNGGYVIDAVQDAQGVRPAHIKDRVRAYGPTVRPDLTLKPADPTAGTWVI